MGPKMGPFQFLRNGFLIERDAKTLQTCHKLLFYHDLFIMAGILLASSIELILPTLNSKSSSIIGHVNIVVISRVIIILTC